MKVTIGEFTDHLISLPGVVDITTSYLYSVPFTQVKLADGNSLYLAQINDKMDKRYLCWPATADDVGTFIARSFSNFCQSLGNEINNDDYLWTFDKLMRNCYGLLGLEVPEDKYQDTLDTVTVKVELPDVLRSPLVDILTGPDSETTDTEKFPIFVDDYRGKIVATFIYDITKNTTGSKVFQPVGFGKVETKIINRVLGRFGITITTNDTSEGDWAITGVEVTCDETNKVLINEFGIKVNA